MKASELIEQLQTLISTHGDLDVAIDDTFELRPVGEVDMSAEEDGCFILWWE